MEGLRPPASQRRCPCLCASLLLRRVYIQLLGQKNGIRVKRLSSTRHKRRNRLHGAHAPPTFHKLVCKVGLCSCQSSLLCLLPTCMGHFIIIKYQDQELCSINTIFSYSFQRAFERGQSRCTIIKVSARLVRCQSQAIPYTCNPI